MSKEERPDLSAVQAEIRRLAQELAAAAEDLFSSKRWRIGGAAAAARRLLFRRPSPSPEDHIRLMLRELLRRCDQAVQSGAEAPAGSETCAGGRGKGVRGIESGRPKVSVVVTVRDQPRLTHRCLESLLNRTEYPGLEAVVIDNGSQPETAGLLDRLAAADARMFVAHNRENRSFAAANNQGARLTDGELLVFLNNDTEICRPDWLTRLVEELLRRPSAGAAGPRLVLPDGKGVQSAGILIDIDSESGAVTGVSEIQAERPSRPVEGLTAACLLVDRKVFEEADGFDERFWYGMEDVDLSLKLRSRGYELYHCAESVVVHAASATRRYNETTPANRRSLAEKWAGRAGGLLPFDRGG